MHLALLKPATGSYVCFQFSHIMHQLTLPSDGLIDYRANGE